MHFFIEVDKFSQSASQKYGPVSGNEDTQYRVTSKFTASNNAKAFAVTSGKIFIQQVGTSNTVNLVLVPKYIEDVDFTPVQFFIYRGLSLNSFIDSNQILLDTNSNKTDLTSKIRANYNKFKQQRGQTPTNPEISCIGFNITSTTNANTEVLEDVLLTCSHLHAVDEGDYIGNFITSGDCGFEVVMQEQFYNYTLGDLRAAEKVFSVSAPAIGTLEGNEGIAVQRARENILNFVDPAPFFIRYFEYDKLNKLRLDYKNSSSNNINTCTWLDDIYNNIVSKFNTSRILYIDIRNELYYSLNYFKDNQGATGNDLGKHISYSFDEVNYNSNNNYYKNYWPLLSIDLTNENVGFTFCIKFRKLYNPHPLLYLDYASYDIRNNDTNTFPLPAYANSKFIDENPINSEDQNWSNPFKIGISTKKYTYFIKLMLIRKEIPETLPNTVITTLNYADNIFGPIIDLPVNFASIGTQWISYKSKRFFNAYDKLGIIGVGDSSLVASSNDVLFISKIIHFYIPVWQKNIPIIEGSGNMSVTKAIPIVNGKSIKTNILDSLQKYYANEKIEFKVEERIDDTSTISTFVVSEINTPEQLQGSNNYRFTYLMTKSEYDSLVTQSKTNLNHSYFYPTLKFGTYTGQIDSENRQYHTTTIKIVGFNNSGLVAEYDPFKEVIVVDDVRFKTSDTTFSWLQNLRISNKAAFTLNEFLDLVRIVEYYYGNKLKNTNHLPLDSNPKETLTRIRLHYYKFPFNFYDLPNILEFARALAFNYGVPNSPYMEKIPDAILGNCIPNQGIIPPNFFSYISLSCRYRVLRAEYHSNETALRNRTVVTVLKELDTLTYERITSSQDMKHIGSPPKVIDIGHALYGLDALLNTGSGELTGKPGLPFRNTSYNQGFNIQHSIDFTSFVGDLASVVGEAYLVVNGNNNDVTNSLLDEKYLAYFDNTDILGDIDIFGLKKAWDKVSTNSNFKLSDVLQHYYGQTVPSDNNDNPSHYSKRFRIFCEANDLLINGAVNIDTVLTYKTKREELIDRIAKFTTFYFSIKFQPEFVGIDLARVLFLNLSTIDITNDVDWKKDFNQNSISSNHVDYVLNKFITYITTQYNAGN